MTNHDQITTFLIGWLVLASLLVLFLFGIDKRRAKRAPSLRISESSLLWLSALGGWPGGLLGILLFRHKSTKLSFLLRFFTAFVVFVLLMGGVLRMAGKL